MDTTNLITRVLNTVYYEKYDKGTVADMKLGKHEKVSPNCCLSSAVKEEELMQIIAKAKEVFLSQPASVDIGAPVNICGDIHGQFPDLLRIFDNSGFPPKSNYLFLGDYVDRGKQNLETITLLILYKIKFPKNFFLLRGNHECAPVNRHYGFLDECNRRYGSERLWQSFQDMFAVMPLSAIVGRRILCMHGGISPHLRKIEDLKKIKRPTEATGDTLDQDLLWADPVVGQIGFKASERGASYGFGEDVLHKFLKENDLDMVARAHQVVQDGYEFFGNRKLVTVFSAPYYCGQFENAAAILSVDDKMMCSFDVLRPMPRDTKIECRKLALASPIEPEKNDKKPEEKHKNEEKKGKEDKGNKSDEKKPEAKGNKSDEKKPEANKKLEKTNKNDKGMGHSVDKGDKAEKKRKQRSQNKKN